MTQPHRYSKIVRGIIGLVEVFLPISGAVYFFWRLNQLSPETPGINQIYDGILNLGVLLSFVALALGVHLYRMNFVVEGERRSIVSVIEKKINESISGNSGLRYFDDKKYQDSFAEDLSAAKSHIILMGTTFDTLPENPHPENLANAVKRGCTVEIFALNPDLGTQVHAFNAFINNTLGKNDDELCNTLMQNLRKILTQTTSRLSIEEKERFSIYLVDGFPLINLRIVDPLVQTGEIIAEINTFGCGTERTRLLVQKTEENKLYKRITESIEHMRLLSRKMEV